eukprot:TRINITY_DN689_c0_g1_i4.p2 TRINITY_DN689_c0_g1~~TRINITY_DN689_c0_g1_i4.p2  ORF type:complete len:189 (+),score=22.69 TRINITY_DN689_c0_g1_i4:29-568(+)
MATLPLTYPDIPAPYYGYNKSGRPLGPTGKAITKNTAPYSDPFWWSRSFDKNGRPLDGSGRVMGFGATPKYAYRYDPYDPNLYGYGMNTYCGLYSNGCPGRSGPARGGPSYQNQQPQYAPQTEYAGPYPPQYAPEPYPMAYGAPFAAPAFDPYAAAAYGSPYSPPGAPYDYAAPEYYGY